MVCVAMIECPCGVTHVFLHRDQAELEAEIAACEPYTVTVKGREMIVYPELQVLHGMTADGEWRYHR